MNISNEAIAYTNLQSKSCNGCEKYNFITSFRNLDYNPG